MGKTLGSIPDIPRGKTKQKNPETLCRAVKETVPAMPGPYLAFKTRWLGAPLLLSELLGAARPARSQGFDSKVHSAHIPAQQTDSLGSDEAGTWHVNYKPSPPQAHIHTGSDTCCFPLPSNHSFLFWEQHPSLFRSVRFI